MHRGITACACTVRVGISPHGRIDSVKRVFSGTPLTKIDLYGASISSEIYFTRIESSRKGQVSLKSHD